MTELATAVVDVASSIDAVNEMEWVNPGEVLLLAAEFCELFRIIGIAASGLLELFFVGEEAAVVLFTP